MNSYAERVARHLVAAWPERAEEIAVDGEGDLSLEIECPSDSADAGLWIHTWNEDVVVGFHTHHSHFSDWEQSGTDDHIAVALETMDDILAERLVVVSWYSRDSSSRPSSGEPRMQDDELRRSRQGVKGWLRRRRFPRTGWLPYDLGLLARGVESTVRSWRSSYDTGSARRH